MLDFFCSYIYILIMFLIYVDFDEFIFIVNFGTDVIKIFEFFYSS